MRIFKRRRLVKKGLTAAVKRASGERHPVLVYLDRGVAPRVLTGLLLLAALTFIVAKGRVSMLRVTIGGVARQDIIATRGFRYEDKAERDRLRAEARAEVPEILRLDEAKVRETFAAFAALLGEAVQPSTATSSGDAEARRQALDQKAAQLFPQLEPEQRRELLSDPAYLVRLDKLRQVVLGFANVRTCQKGLPDVQFELECISTRAFSARLDAAVEKAFADEPQGVHAILKIIARDGAVFEHDSPTIRLLQDRRAKAVPPQYTVVPRLATIVKEGEKVTAVHLDKLRAYNEALRAAVSRETRYSYRATVGVTVAVLLGLGALYLMRFDPRVFRHNSRLALIGVMAVAALGLSKGIALIEPPSESWRSVLQYPVLLALPAMVVAMAFTVRLAFVVTMVLAIISGIHYEAMTAEMTIIPMFVLLGVVEGSAAAIYARTIRYRREFVRAGAMIGFLSFIIIVVVGMLGGLHYTVLLRQGLGGLIAGVVATTLAWLLLPLLETLFHITTNISLVELGDSNHPLLKRMVMEAPGTYHHSLVVGNLAESAAEAIGANPLLARVGALYHDIGKLKKPDYFSENELHARSRHDTLIPSMSSLIITSHVKDGVDLAYKYRLKPAIVDIVREHHGTSLVYYFYKRAEQMNGNAAGVDEADFRYPGPKPQSKEAAIIMLADAVEAAARAMEKPTASKIKTLVRELILARFNDGQLDESELTLRDLHRIQESFTHIILGTLHQRVKYPKDGEPSEPEPKEDEAHEPEPTGAESRPE
jgi:putative nucleotidyltransferase with HDIG domain